MDNERISHGLAVLAEDMPTPDIGDIVTTARTRIRRRRAVHATWIGTAAVLVGVLTVMVTNVGAGPTISAAAHPTSVPNNTPIVDDRARALDQQLNQVKNETIPSGMIISADPNETIKVDGRTLVFEFATMEAGDPTALNNWVPLFTGRSYELNAKLSDAQGWGTVSIQVLHKNSADKAARLGTCATVPGDCQSTQFPDGTRAAVGSGESGRGYPNSGTDIRMEAQRPDGTLIEVISSNLPWLTGPVTEDPATHPTQPTRPQPPLSAAELLKFATAFTY